MAQQPPAVDATQQLRNDVVELQTLRDQAHWKAQEFREKYKLRLAGDPYPELGDDFVVEVLRAMQDLRINPFTNEVA